LTLGALNSFLYVKMSDPQHMGDIMPSVGGPLDEGLLTAVRIWIEDGAQR